MNLHIQFKKGVKMQQLFGIEIDLLSLLPALFAVILSIYNYYKLSRPANIYPTEIVNYGIISSSYESSFKFVLPLVFHNDGSKKGIIKKVKVGFKQNSTITYIDTLTKVRLNELDDNIAQLTDWNKFIEHGYRVIQPSYPISIPADSSVDETFVGICPYDEKLIPLDQECEYIIEVYFGKNKVNKINLPFYLSEEDIPDDRLVWISPNYIDKNK